MLRNWIPRGTAHSNVRAWPFIHLSHADNVTNYGTKSDIVTYSPKFSYSAPKAKPTENCFFVSLPIATDWLWKASIALSGPPTRRVFFRKLALFFPIITEQKRHGFQSVSSPVSLHKYTFFGKNAYVSISFVSLKWDRIRLKPMYLTRFCLAQIVYN